MDPSRLSHQGDDRRSRIGSDERQVEENEYDHEALVDAVNPGRLHALEGL